MKKSKNQYDDPIYTVKINSCVSSSTFAKSLANHIYGSNLDFPNDLTKTVVKEILIDQLFYYGINGQYESGFFESSYENGERYNAIYSEALNWVEKNYPYLKTE